MLAAAPPEPDPVRLIVGFGALFLVLGLLAVAAHLFSNWMRDRAEASAVALGRQLGMELRAGQFLPGQPLQRLAPPATPADGGLRGPLGSDATRRRRGA